MMYTPSWRKMKRVLRRHNRHEERNKMQAIAKGSSGHAADIDYDVDIDYAEELCCCIGLDWTLK